MGDVISEQPLRQDFVLENGKQVSSWSHNRNKRTLFCSKLKYQKISSRTVELKFLFTMKTLVFFTLASIALAPTASGMNRAPAKTTLADCLCQCNRFTTTRYPGKKHGNCLSADKTGAKWCYIAPMEEIARKVNKFNYDHDIPPYDFELWKEVNDYDWSLAANEFCPDEKRSELYPKRKTSNHACTTPELDSIACRKLFHKHFADEYSWD